MSAKQLVVTGEPQGPIASTVQFVTMHVGEALIGISVHSVQDVIHYQPITQIPLAPSVIAGAINVRGRIVTAIDMRHKLGLGPYPELSTAMMIVVEHQHELYALMVDSVGDVLTLAAEEQERLPANMNDNWRSIAAGIYKLDGNLLVIIEVGNVIDNLAKGQAA
jgi:purine-binding chemotaxis protein CheW